MLSACLPLASVVPPSLIRQARFSFSSRQRRELWDKHHAKPEVVISVIGLVVVPIRGTAILGAVAIIAAAQHAAVARRWAGRIGNRGLAIIGWNPVAVIKTPFQYIAVHIVKTVAVG